MKRRMASTGALAAATLLATTVVADARTFEVTRTGDPAPGNCAPSDCSLREAVLAANERAGADRIVLRNTRRDYRLTIPNETLGVQEDGGQTGDLDTSNDPLAIVHPGRGRATIRGADGLNDRLFTAFARLRIAKLALTGGEAQGDGDSGGAIQGTGATIVVSRSRLARNTAVATGGAIDLDEGAGRLVITRSALIANRSTESTSGAIRSAEGIAITIRRSLLSRNVADTDGGAIRLSGTGPVVIRDSTIAGNRSGAAGGGIQHDGENTLRIVNSTIADNFAESQGGGLHVRDDDTFRTTIVNSTIAGNRANGEGGGIAATGAAPQVSVNATTIVRNVADFDDNQGIAAIGGGLFGENADSFAVRNSIVALNRDAALGNDCQGIDPVDSLGNNLISTDLGCDDFDGPNDRVRSNPKLGKLKRNGGPTKTVALKKGSPAIGKAHRPSTPNRDQRGRKRDSKPDIGAFERGA